MPRHKSSKRIRRNRTKKHTCLRSRRRHRQSGGYGYIRNPQKELVSKYVGDEGMGVPTITEA